MNYICTFHPKPEEEDKRWTFRYIEVYRVNSCRQGMNECVITTFRLMFLVALFLTICIHAGFYEMETKTMHLPNDGDPVTWILRFGNIVALMDLLYFILSVTLVREPSNADGCHLHVLHILYVIAFPLTWLSLIEYFSKVYPNSTVIKGEEATIIVSFILMNLDFFLCCQYLEFKWITYPLIVLNIYLFILALVSFGTHVYPALPWMDEPTTAAIGSFVVNVVFVVIYGILSIVSKWRREYFNISDPYASLPPLPKQNPAARDQVTTAAMGDEV